MLWLRDYITPNSKSLAVGLESEEDDESLNDEESEIEEFEIYTPKKRKSIAKQPVASTSGCSKLTPKLFEPNENVQLSPKETSNRTFVEMVYVTLNRFENLDALEDIRNSILNSIYYQMKEFREQNSNKNDLTNNDAESSIDIE